MDEPLKSNDNSKTIKDENLNSMSSKEKFIYLHNKKVGYELKKQECNVDVNEPAIELEKNDDKKISLKNISLVYQSSWYLLDK